MTSAEPCSSTHETRLLPRSSLCPSLPISVSPLPRGDSDLNPSHCDLSCLLLNVVRAGHDAARAPVRILGLGVTPGAVSVTASGVCSFLWPSRTAVSVQNCQPRSLKPGLQAVSPDTDCAFYFMCSAAQGILVLPPRIKPVPPVLGTRSPNHWAVREVPTRYPRAVGGAHLLQ